MTLLKFGKGNAKLNTAIATFSLPSGYTCPCAKLCFSVADKVTGKIRDGKDTTFRCFSASQEAQYKNVRLQRWHNFDLLKAAKTIENMTALITQSHPTQDYTRIHVAGDFFSQDYFDAWLAVANSLPSKVFYAYTKSIPFWVNRLGVMPKNFVLTASYGGRYDNLIVENKLKYAQVVFSEQDAKNLNLEIDHDDSHAILGTQPFALLIHGTQPAKTPAAQALSKLKKLGIGGYSKRKA